MALKLEAIRALAERVAASHGLDVVDVEYLGGGGKHRTLRVFIEKNAAERAKLRERVTRLRAERDAEGGVEAVVEVKEQEPERAEVDDAELDGEAEADFEQGDDTGDESLFSPEESQEEADAAFLDGLPSVTNLEFLSGITHEDCEIFSRDFGVVLDVEELVPGTEYMLEVSSPGLDRRLTRAEDYRRFTGSLVKVQTFEAVNGGRHLQGRVASVDGERVVLELAGGKRTGKKAGKQAVAAGPGSVEVMLGNVEKAQLVPEF